MNALQPLFYTECNELRVEHNNIRDRLQPLLSHFVPPYESLAYVVNNLRTSGVALVLAEMPWVPRLVEWYHCALHYCVNHAARLPVAIVSI